MIDPDALLQQARAMINAGPHSLPTAIDLRRSLSNTYYAVFHTLTTELADQLIQAFRGQAPPDQRRLFTLLLLLEPRG